MKTTIGGDRLGSGSKQNISARNYERSTHDLSYLWRSSMSAGTLVPFMKKVGLPGDNWDIDLMCEVLTLPTIGPLFGSFKVQLDVFCIPIRLYNADLHMNRLNVGMNMQNVLLPQISVMVKNNFESEEESVDDNAQINPSSLLKYLGISGIGKINAATETFFRFFNGVAFMAYWDVYKYYYANKQEERGFYIHTSTESAYEDQNVIAATVSFDGNTPQNILNTGVLTPVNVFNAQIVLQFNENALETNAMNCILNVDLTDEPLSDTFPGNGVWDDVNKTLTVNNDFVLGAPQFWQLPSQTPIPVNEGLDVSPSLKEFDLNNIDEAKLQLLREQAGQFFVNNIPLPPYNDINARVDNNGELINMSKAYSQEMLGIKTYQSDLFNNWINTEWLDGQNGVNEVTRVDTSDGSFTIDALNLANKVYNMLNRVAISGGTYDDWLDAVYTEKRQRGIYSPMYLGSLIKELAFQQVISNSDTEVNDNTQPLGTLAGRGVLTNKNKGGRIRYKVSEPCYLMGIVSLTPRVDYSQGNDWDVNLENMDDFHKPALDGIGYQELITEQMAWQSTGIASDVGQNYVLTKRSAGKQPAWINYMTAVNKTYGNFAIETKEMFMTLNRRYDTNPVTGEISDLTTYIDPTKYNQIFAQTNLDAQNFWVQIGVDIKARRKMSAKIIPNL